jgi:arginase
MKPLLCIGVPYWLGTKTHYTGSVEVMQSLAQTIGAPWVEAVPQPHSTDPVTAINRGLAQVIQAHPDHLPLIFAGDCTTAIGALAGLASQRPSVVWYDAHGDFNTPETTLSGFLGGMPLAALVGRGNAALLDEVGLAPIPEEQVILTDARDLDPAEADLLRSSAVRHLPQVTDLLTAELPASPLYIHMDTDVITPAEMPAQSYLSAGGPTLAATITTLERLLTQRPIAGVLFSLWNNQLPNADLAAASTLHMARSMADLLRS